jgi:poly(A) polymerase
MINIIKKHSAEIKPVLDFVKKIIQSALAPLADNHEESKVRVYARPEHNISRSRINENALKVLYRLQKEGYEAYLVGGCVRDLLLGREPKDFDVATNADPEEIRKVFRNCRIIGRRFRLAHVHFGKDVIEVATFRGGATENQNERQVLNNEGRLLRDNVYGTLEEDVWRRDFTVNALYYNIKDFSVIDFVNGMADHQAGVLRLIGDPETRFREDPVRMLRAVRFAVKLGFKIEPACEQALRICIGLLASIPPARLYDEVIKLFLFGYAVQTFELLEHYGLFQVLFPDTAKSLELANDGVARQMLVKAMENSDNRIGDGKSVTAYFLFSALLWEPVSSLAQVKISGGLPEFLAYQESANEVIGRQVKMTAFSRHISLAMREVWGLQPKFNFRVGAKPARLLGHLRFRAAFDFLALRAETGGADAELVAWWLLYQNADETEQRKMTQPGRGKTNGKPGRKKSYRKRSPNNVTGTEA